MEKYPIESTTVGAAESAAFHQRNQPLKPEWLRVPDAIRVFGICRSSIYSLISEGKIKSTCLRKRGALRGIRLLSYDSLAALIEESAREQEGEGK